jgi:predicted dehydrogenase
MINRRNFIIKSSLATAGVATSCSAMGYAINVGQVNDSVNIGIIGTGSRGSGLIPFINDIKNLNVAACCDLLSFRLEDGLSKVQRNVKGYSDYRKLLENHDLDAVLIATPFHTHAKIATDALDAGLHVYCEKTLAKGLEAIEALVEKTKISNKIFQTGHQYHSSRLYMHVVNLIKNGELGKVVAFECQWNRNGDWRRPVKNLTLERQINWRMYREYSGGLLAELCSHQIDFVNWVCGATPQKVVGVGGIDYWKDGRDTFDNIHLIYTYPEGVKATFTCLTSNAMGDYQIKVIGDKGTIALGYDKAWFYPEGTYQKEYGNVDGVSGATTNWVEGKGIPIEMEHIHPSKQALVDFQYNIINGERPNSDIYTGANTAICVQMGLDAMYENKIIERSQSKFQ